MNIIVCYRLKSWWNPFVLNTSKKIKNLHDNILELKIHFESRLILIQWLDEKDYIKSMYIEYITYIFSTTITKHKKIEKKFNGHL
jgi:hypothetical protein